MYLVEIGVCILTYFKKCNQIRYQVRYLCDKYYDCSKLDNMTVTETKNRTSILYEQYLLLWKYNSKSEIF